MSFLLSSVLSDQAGRLDNPHNVFIRVDNMGLLAAFGDFESIIGKKFYLLALDAWFTYRGRCSSFSIRSEEQLGTGMGF
ncbi:hypothetical protein HCH15_02360 [Corynebacterium testudinoris]|uniref:hypothetical protein n=1 Tax=Corynebacterium testudinoris TaxID=136857 RepID=UPI0011876BD7|nr:hypothetical protein [Corynebacterium testudinoris]MBX8995029.1 hypothetical protein [Corynebacterium testudinoris]